MNHSDVRRKIKPTNNAAIGIALVWDLRGYRLFVHISASLGGFMFTKRANRGAVRKSLGLLKTIITQVHYVKSL